MTATTDTAPEAPRVLSLSEAAARLNMKRPNVAKFLARRGVQPAFGKAQGYFWREDDIERVKAEREADERRMASDRLRREAALRNAEQAPEAPLPVRLGHTQRDMLQTLLRRPTRPGSDAERLAMKRLEKRGYVEPVDQPGPAAWQLTGDGRRIAVQL